jgi:hypothetical protein
METTEKNYWIEHPEMLIHECFNKLHAKDKSVGKQESSSIMWALYYYAHPESPMFNVPGKREEIAKKLQKTIKGFLWEDYEQELKRYSESVLSVGEQELYEWSEMISLRKSVITSSYMAEMAKDPEERDVKKLKELDSMMANTAKIFSDYVKIVQTLKEESIEKTTGDQYEDDV